MSKLRDIYWKALRILPKKAALYVMYFRGYHRILNLKDPKYYGEKIQWLKLYGGVENLGIYVDKYAVREYVKKVIENFTYTVIVKVFVHPESLQNHVKPTLKSSGW